MSDAERFPTFRRGATATISFMHSIRMVVAACWAVGIASVGTLAYVAAFLRRFHNSWPEMLCYEPAPSQLQLFIVAPILIGIGTIALSHRAAGSDRRNVVMSCAFLLSATWTLAVVVNRIHLLSTFVYDAGCTHTARWFSSNFLLELFTTQVGGYTVCLVLASLLAESIIRKRNFS